MLTRVKTEWRRKTAGPGVTRTALHRLRYIGSCYRSRIGAVLATPGPHDLDDDLKHHLDPPLLFESILVFFR